jgi:tRNA (mo5U34)-methyltransferase
MSDLRWYHTLDLPGGVTTPGEYDLRGTADRLPWPALDGARCLDVGSRDGFYAFEMERRGAREVVSLDLDDPADFDMPGVGHDPAAMRAEVDAGNRAFEHARSALGSSVQRRYRSVYELDPEREGTFDFALIGTLLHHLRDPVGALMAMRRVLRGDLLVVGAVRHGPSLLTRTATTRVWMKGAPFWHMPNPPALRRMVEAAGFEVRSMSAPFFIPWGPGSPRQTVRYLTSPPLRMLPHRLAMRPGALHVAVRATPARP